MHAVSEDPTNVLNCDPKRQQQLSTLLKPYGINIEHVTDDQNIPGSFFGEREAGLIGNKLYLRHDTPVHSALHESGHYICMDPIRRGELDTNAEGDYDEENGVCYLQILLADHLPEMGKERMLTDMDSWGYTFRLGSAKAWFEQDSEDAKHWLINHNIIDDQQLPTWQNRKN
ncbi:MAG: hypothetical protein COA63_006705 [Methylophaga sp.]|nr:hypothetical protein [Methylophaga sp.]